MVVLNVEIISKEMIKPSFPTPNHRRNHKLSLIDQMAPSTYIPLIFFYQLKESNPTIIRPEVCGQLKQSLSYILTIFYPLAGRIQENSSVVDCNDAGAEFIEARADARLLEVIKDPKMEELEQFLPVKPLGNIGNVVLSMKVSFFDCGGIAVAVCLSHKIADGTSLVSFMNAWSVANFHGGETQAFSHPKFDLAVHFPPRNFSNYSTIRPITNEKITMKRFVFSGEKMAKLKQLAAAPGDDHQMKINPTRVEAVSAFLWQRFIEVAKVKTDSEKKLFAAVHVVNMRARMNPPLSEHVFGNCWRPTTAELDELQGECEYTSLVNKLRVSIRKIDDEYIKKMQKGENLDDHSNKRSDLFKRNVQVLGFTSWCRFPVYEVDFGWGKPVWACTTTFPFKNLVILMSTPCGDGVEAWVNIAEDELHMLEAHYKLLN